MDDNSVGLSQEFLQSTVLGQMNGHPIDHSDLPAACVLCQRILSLDNDEGDLEAISMCGDCKFLFLEEFGTPTEDAHRRRITRARRTRHSSSESIENLFSQQFSHMINLVRQSHSSASDNENQTADTGTAARFLQHTRPRSTPSESRSTPSGSRRWRSVLSDTESDGFDSLYGEIELNVSCFSGYRPFQSESDAISFSAYGGDSDASVDGHSFLDTDIFTHLDVGSDIDTDTDIDPMGEGLNQWNSDDQEGDEEGNEWEEVDAEENDAEFFAGFHSQSSLGRTGSNGPVTWNRQLRSPEFEGSIGARLSFVGTSGDYVDARGFDELLERLAEADDSRRGAPPAAVSFVNSLPHLVINKEHEKQDGFACAICKDFFSVGTVVNQLPCFHFYHPSCILPWLTARNSCPVCRYELPTDDKDYKEGKRNTSSSLESAEIQQREMSEEDSSSDINENGEVGGTQHADFVREEYEHATWDRARGRWLFLAAAPIVSLVGIVLLLWLGNRRTDRGVPNRHHDFPGRGQRPNHSSSSSWPCNQRENRSTRWWSLF